jgi:hypothetical protein
MAKDKYDFIQEVLNNHKLSSAQRERILLLTSAEIKRDKELGRVLEERVIRLEEMVGINAGIRLTNNSDDGIALFQLRDEDLKMNESVKYNNNSELINPSLPKMYYNPSYLYNYLLTYNQDPILKSTCHLIDSNELEKIKEYCNTDTYNFDKHYTKIIESYDKINNLFAPTYIKALIRGYLTGKKYKGEELSGWSDDKIVWHWSHKSIKEWSYENPGVPPNPDVGLSEKLENGGFEFVTPLKIKEEYLQSLGELVIHFKKMFHIREDNSLLKILQRQNTYRNWNDKIDFRLDKFSFSENIEFFTDIDKLLQSYNEIIQLIIEFKKDEKPIVFLSLSENENSIYFSINCINGVYGKSLSSAKNRLIGQKYEAIIKKLNGLCNIYLQADFGQKVFSKLSIWDDEWNIQKERVNDPCDKAFQGGVEHILEFKRR